ncbi:mucin-binding protein, partial [Lactovum odontotermitis]
PFKFTAPWIMQINYNTPLSVKLEMPFTNTISVQGRDYTFQFEKYPLSTDAISISDDNKALDGSAVSTSLNGYQFHEDIPNNDTFTELQESGGETADGLLENRDVMHSFSLSSDSALGDVLGGQIQQGIYYVSAETNKIQGNETNKIAMGISNRYIKGVADSGDGLTLAELQADAASKGSGIYYSRQSSGSYLMVEYVKQEDTVFDESEIKSMVENCTYYKMSSHPEEDLQATIDYYKGALNNRASLFIYGFQVAWADDTIKNTLTAQELNDDGSSKGTPSVFTSTPNDIGTDNTPVKSNFVDLSGNPLTDTTTGKSIVTAGGLPTGKENDIAVGTESATTTPGNVPGYTLITAANLDSLTAEQREQLESTLASKGLSIDKMDSVNDKAIFGTTTDTVPYPGHSGVYYDASGNIVTDGTGTEGYGQTDVYYFYVGNPQKVVYNVIDDTDNKTLVSNVKFDEGTSNARLTQTQEDFQKIADSYQSQGYDIVGQIDTVPATFDILDDTDGVTQVINIHLTHHISTADEEETVTRTIHYVYADETSDDNTDNPSVGEAAKDVTQTLTYTRTVSTDEVTHTSDDPAWTPSEGIFAAATSPEVANYTPDQASVPEAAGVGAKDADTDVYVIYTANTEAATESQEVTRTIHYVYEDGSPVGEAAPDLTETTTFTRTGTKNLATGKTVWNDWTPADGSFTAADSPAIAGYTPDKPVVEAATVAAEDDDITETVTYKADTQKIVYTVIDDTIGENLEENIDFDKGSTNDACTRGQDDLQGIADDYKDKGYDIVSVDTLPESFDADTATDQIVYIHLSHATEDSQESKEVDETIHYVYEDGTEAAADKTDKVTFTRTNTTDKVTGEVISSTDWIAENDDTTFDAVTSPEIDGYTADKSTVDAVTGLTADSEDTEVTVTYTKNTEDPAPTTSSSTPKASISVQPTSQIAKKSVLPSTGDETHNTVAVAGGLAVLGAGLLGVIRHLRRKKQ